MQHGFIACPSELSLTSLEDRFNLISHTGWVLLSAIWTILTQARIFPCAEAIVQECLEFKSGHEH